MEPAVRQYNDLTIKTNGIQSLRSQRKNLDEKILDSTEIRQIAVFNIKQCLNHNFFYSNAVQ